ncbi:MAG: hypothetical protein AVDCRST_MAG56-2538 [uncultured Cytophagales bacterium]|uniref:Uncharacterized protein n=1 Tax=uncultured Cytophagales bacterium TaxID=158755 RepID=A0A6J4IUK8_9SPHI|nr:MAG: hypothetical protein AVDCRST_MAG56-2538 [uncultured Cytophagales bacterium]
MRGCRLPFVEWGPPSPPTKAATHEKSLPSGAGFWLRSK